MQWGNEREAGYILLETVVLGIVVLAAVAALSLFARTALMEEQSAAHTNAAFLVRERFSVMAAELDRGHPPLDGVLQEEQNGITYEVRSAVAAQGKIYDVTMYVAWTLHGREETLTFVRRMRAHDAGTP